MEEVAWCVDILAVVMSCREGEEEPALVVCLEGEQLLVLCNIVEVDAGTYDRYFGRGVHNNTTQKGQACLLNGHLFAFDIYVNITFGSSDEVVVYAVGKLFLGSKEGEFIDVVTAITACLLG